MVAFSARNFSENVPILFDATGTSTRSLHENEFRLSAEKSAPIFRQQKILLRICCLVGDMDDAKSEEINTTTWRKVKREILAISSSGFRFYLIEYLIITVS